MNLVAQINTLKEKIKELETEIRINREISKNRDSTFEKTTEKIFNPVVKSTKELYRKYELDAGWDLKCITDFVISAKEITPLIQTGVRVEIPDGYFGLVKERSGMAAKGMLVVGGVIDSGYRGEVFINFANLGSYDYKVKAGDRIAQLIILPCSAVMTVGELSKSDRGEKGFGSTGR